MRTCVAYHSKPDLSRSPSIGQPCTHPHNDYCHSAPSYLKLRPVSLRREEPRLTAKSPIVCTQTRTSSRFRRWSDAVPLYP